MHDVVRAAREAVAALVSTVDEGAHLRQCRVCYETFDDAGGTHRAFCWIGKLATAISEFDRPPAVEEMASAVYRKGRITALDYDEATEALRLAKSQLPDLRYPGDPLHCRICEDGDHTAETCHHNPLVLARRWAAATHITRCHHCGYIAYNDEEALAHFGRHDDEVAKCLTLEAEGQIRAKLAKLTFDFYNRRLGELMHQAAHWAMPEHEHPLAVHHRVTAADECYQAVIAFDPDRAAGHGEVFANMEAALVRPPINPPGAYPPTPELHQYRASRYVVERLDALKKQGEDRG